jgi:hypothetical protein
MQLELSRMRFKAARFAALSSSFSCCLLSQLPPAAIMQRAKGILRLSVQRRRGGVLVSIRTHASALAARAHPHSLLQHDLCARSIDSVHSCSMFHTPSRIANNVQYFDIRAALFTTHARNVCFVLKDSLGITCLIVQHCFLI